MVMRAAGCAQSIANAREKKKLKMRIRMMKKGRRDKSKCFGPKGPDALGVFVYEWCCGCFCSARAEVRQGWHTNTAP